jgi:hypothetical protein
MRFAHRMPPYRFTGRFDRIPETKPDINAAET